MGIKDLLRYPIVYQSFQVSGGFFGARVRAIAECLSIQSGNRVVDVGCGPGFMVDYLPSGIDYIGFDLDERYITYANKNFGHRATFHCKPFDAAAAAAIKPADFVLMNGVIHHIDDATAIGVLSAIREALSATGILFTLDSCFHDGQSPIARFLLSNDRGRFVRPEATYRSLLQSVFGDVQTRIREDLSWIPYTWLIGLSRNSASDKAR